MKNIETLFSQLDSALGTHLTIGTSLLELSKNLHSNKITMSEVNKALSKNGFCSKNIRELYGILRKITSSIKKEIRDTLLYSEHENFTYSLLFYVLKCHFDLRSNFNRAAVIYPRYMSLYEELDTFLAEDDKGNLNVIYFPFNNILQPLSIGRMVINQIKQTSDELLKIVRQEFSIRYEDVGKLFQFDQYNWQPAPLPKLKLLLTETTTTAKQQELTTSLNTPSLQDTVGKKIKWNGSLKQFAELINELEIKGWIEPIAHGELSPSIKTLTDCFDFSLTQKKEGSNSASSLMQYLKASEREDKIYSKRYIKQFDCILPNPTKK